MSHEGIGESSGDERRLCLRAFDGPLVLLTFTTAYLSGWYVIYLSTWQFESNSDATTSSTKRNTVCRTLTFGATRLKAPTMLKRLNVYYAAFYSLAIFSRASIRT